MADNIQTGDFAGSAVTVRTTDLGGVHTPHHRDPEAHALLEQIIDSQPSGGASEATLAAILAKLIGAPATEAGQATIATILGAHSGYLDGVEGALGALNLKDFATQTTLAAILAKIIAAPSTEAKQDSEIAAVNRVGTRAYGAVQRAAVASASAVSSAISATEILLHASTKCFVLAVAGTGTPVVAADTGVPLEAGEKFHMRITSGQRIAVIRDTADGFLHIAPVV